MLIAGELAVKLGLDDSRFQAGMTSAHQKFQNLGKNLTQAGAALSTSVTLPLTLLGKEIFDVGVAFEKAMNTFQATTGASADVMTQAGKVAKDLGADLKLPATSAGDAALAMTELAKAGLSAQESMDAARGTLQLAAAAQIGEARAAEVTANALNAFNLEATESVRVSDLLAAAANSSSAGIDDIALSMQQSSASAAALKIPIDDLVTAISLMANAGIKGSDAGTSLKTMMAALTPSTDKASAAMKRLGIDAFDAQGKFIGLEAVIKQAEPALASMTDEQRAFNIEAAFGSDAMRAANILLGEGAEGFRLMDEQVNRAGASLELAGAKTKGLGGALDGIKSQLETVALSIFQAVAPGLEKVARFFGELFTKIGELNPALLQSGVAFAAVLAVAGPVALAIGGIVTAIAAIGAPLAAAIAAVGAFAAAYAGNWAGLRDKVNALVTELGEFYLRHKDTIDAAVQGIVAIIKFLAERWAENIGQMIDGIRLFLKVIEGDWQGAWNLYKEIATKKSEETNASVMATLTALGDKVKETWNKILESTKEVWNQLPELIGKTAGQIVKAIIDMGVKIMVTFVDLKQKIVAWFLQLVPEGVRGATNFREAVVAGLQNLPQMILEIMMRAIRFLAGLPAEFFKVGRSIGSRLWEGFKEGMGIHSPSLIEKAITAIAKAFETLPAAAGRAANGVANTITEWAEFAIKVIEVFKSTTQAAREAGQTAQQAADDWAGALEKMSQGTATQSKSMVSSIGSVATAMGGLAMMVGGIIGGRAGAIISSIGGGVAAGAQIGALFGGPVGAGIGAIIGGIGGAIAGIFGSRKSAEQKERERLQQEQLRLQVELAKQNVQKGAQEVVQAALKTFDDARKVLEGLAFYTRVPKDAISAFFKDLSKLLDHFISLSAKWSAESLDKAKKLADSIGPVVEIIAAGVLTLNELGKHGKIADKIIEEFFSDFQRVIEKFGALAEALPAELVKAAKKLSIKLGPVAETLLPLIEGLIKLGDFKGVVEGAIDLFGATLEGVMARIADIASRMDKFMVKEAAFFAEQASQVVDLIGTGVDALQGLATLGHIPPEAFETLFEGIKKAIESMQAIASAMSVEFLDRAQMMATKSIAIFEAIKIATEAFTALRDYKSIPSDALAMLASDFEQALRTLNELLTLALRFEEQAIAFKDAITRGSDALTAGLDTFVSGVMDTREAVGSLFGGRDQTSSVLSASRSQQTVVRQGDTSTQFVITIQGQPNPKIQAAIDALVELAGPAGIGRMATQG